MLVSGVVSIDWVRDGGAALELRWSSGSSGRAGENRGCIIDHVISFLKAASGGIDGDHMITDIITSIIHY